jgi:hypothetical protein
MGMGRAVAARIECGLPESIANLKMPLPRRLVTKFLQNSSTFKCLNNII